MNTVYKGVPQFTEEDMERLISQGHELGCHTFFHSDRDDFTCLEYEKSIQKNAEQIRLLFPGIRFKSFSYPFGRISVNAKNTAGRYFDSCRTVNSGINHGVSDLNMLRANRLYSRSVLLETCKSLIEKNSQKRGWLIFYTHDISNNTSQFGCTPEYFERVVDFAFKCGSAVLPVCGAVAKLKLHN